MKKDIHPNYHKVTVVMTDGTKFETKSCVGKEGHEIVLDTDIKTHPAWNAGKNLSLKKTGQMEKFSAKFGDMTFGSKKNTSDADNEDNNTKDKKAS